MFKTAIIDPPWPYLNVSDDVRLRGYVGQINNVQYQTLSVKDIKALDITSVLDSQESYVFLWSTGPFIADALACLEAWGFVYITQMCWMKAKLVDERTFTYSGYGVGYWFRGDHELVLVGKRKKAKSIRTNERSIILAPRQRHSQKPDDLHRLVMKYFPGPYLEVFGRRSFEGWTVIGNEAPGYEGLDIRDTLRALSSESIIRVPVGTQ